MNSSDKPWGIELNTFLMLMHLSLLSGFIIPLGGLLLPILMWGMNKEQFPEIDRHGRVIFNWMISAFIYSLICMVLTFIFIGVLGYMVLGVLSLVFIVIGAIKANSGILWEYPLSIKFIKI